MPTAGTNFPDNKLLTRRARVAVPYILGAPNNLSAQICHDSDQRVIEQVGTYAGCVYHNADTMSLKLRAWPNTGTHQDGWRGDRTSRERDSFSVNLLRLTTYFDFDPNGAAIFNHDTLR